MSTDPKSILLIRPSAIGDNVFASCVIPPLRRRYPHARIYWVTQPESAALFAANEKLDGVIEVPVRRLRELVRGRRYLQAVREWWRFRAALRALRADLAIDLQGLLKSGLIARASGARRRVALGSREGSRVLVHEVVPRRVDDTDLNAEYRDLACFLGLETGDFPMDLAVSREAAQRAEALIASQRMGAGFVALVPFTTRPQKHWIAAHWSALMERLHARTGRRLVLLGGPRDGDAGQALLADLPNPHSCVDLTGPACISLEDASALIRRAALVIGVDTGMTHMAIAHRRPTIAIFGSTVPYLRTRTPHTIIHYENLACAPCRRHPTCNGAWTCMHAVTPAAVLASAERLLGEAWRDGQAIGTLPA